MLGRFNGKTAIVTGASQGIGEAIVRRLLAEGAAVVMVSRDTARGDSLVRELGGCAHFVAGSVTDQETAERAVAVAQGMGGLDILVNNAGVDFFGDLLMTSDDDIANVFAVNFNGALKMLITCARAMKERGGGSIVNVTSRLASVGVPGMSLYGASKGAVLSLTRGAAVEFAPLGIRVNAVAPGFTQTPLMDAWLAAQSDPVATLGAVKRAIPQGRVAEVADVAAAVAYLCADESAHVTGVSLPVDGGYTAA